MAEGAAAVERWERGRRRFCAYRGANGRPPGFDARNVFKDAFGISQAEKPWKVRLLFAKVVATYCLVSGIGYTFGSKE